LYHKLYDMLTADDFKNESVSTVDIFIEKFIYPKLKEDKGNTNVYINLIQMEDINLKSLKDRLKELKFTVSMNKIGIDDVLNISA